MFPRESVMAEKWPRVKLNKALESKTHLWTLLFYFMASGDKIKLVGEKRRRYLPYWKQFQEI